MKYAIFTIFLVLESAGQILEKKGVNQITQYTNVSLSWEFFHKVITNFYLVGGVACVFIGFIIWIYLLSQFNLTYIYPMGALLYILVTVQAWIFLGDQLSVTRMIGIGVIVLGCALINIK